MRGQGTNATAALLRVDGAGKIDVVALDKVKYSKVDLPNAPAAAADASPRNPRTSSVTDMAFVDGRLYVAGLSNEEFSSKLRSVPYPFTAVDGGTSVEIYHGNHGAFETRSPVYTFVPYKVNGETNLIAGYLCTPLVKFPVNSLQPGAKVLGTTIAELGNRNRPLDMIVYKKDGKEFLLMSNNSRGVMKIPTAGFGGADQDRIARVDRDRRRAVRNRRRDEGRRTARSARRGPDDRAGAFQRGSAQSRCRRAAVDGARVRQVRRCTGCVGAQVRCGARCTGAVHGATGATEV